MTLPDPRPDSAVQVTPDGWHRRYTRATFHLGAILLVGFMFLHTVNQWRNVFTVKLDQVANPGAEDRFEDYAVFYAAGRLVLDGRGHELYDVDSIRAAEEEALGRPIGGPAGDGVLPYFNPPFVAGFFAVLAGLPLEVFAALVFSLVLLSVIAAGYALERFLGLRRLEERGVFWLWFLSLGTVMFLALQSQLSMLPLVGWLGFVIFQVRGRETLSGASLALVLVKPQLAIVALALLVWKRRWRTLLAVAGVGGALALISVGIGGLAVVYNYPALLLESIGWEHEKGVILENMYGWSGFYARTLGGTGLLHSILSTASNMVTLALVFYAFRGDWRAKSVELLPLASVGLIATLLVSMHLYRQDLALIALVIAFNAAYSMRTTGRWGWWPLTAVGVWFVQLYGPRLLFEHGLNVQTPALVLLLIASLVLVERARTAEAPRKGAAITARPAAA